VLAVLCVTPLLFWPWARDAYHLAKVAALTVFALPAFAAWMTLGRPGWRQVPRWYLALAGGFLAWTLARSFGGVDWPTAALTAGEWVVTVLLAAGALGLPERDRRKALYALLAGASVAVAIGFGQMVFGRGLLSPYAVDLRSVTFTEERAFSTFGNPIFFGAFLILVFPLAAAETVRRAEAGLRAWVPAAAGLLILAGLALAASRGAFLGLAASLALLALAVPRLKRLALGVAALALAALLVLGLWRPALVEHLLVLGDPGRLLMWKTAVRMVRQAPVMGIGLGQFTQRYPCVQLEVATPGDAGYGVNAIHAHNDYLESAAELGLPGACLFAAAFLGLLAWRGFGMPVWGVRAGIVAVAVQSLFNFPLHTAPTMSFVWLLPAVFVLPEGVPLRAPRAPRARDAWWLLVVLLAALALRPFVRSSYFQMALAYQDAAGEAARRDPGRVPALYGRAAGYFDRALRILPDDSRTRVGFHKGKMLYEAGDLNGAQAEFLSDLDRFPCYPEGWGNLGVIYGVRAMNGEAAMLPKAQEMIEHALRLRPGGKEAASDWNSLGNVRVLAGNEAGALQGYREALRCAPGFVEAASNAVALLLGRHRRAEAQEIVRSLLVAAPDDPEARAMARALGVRVSPSSATPGVSP
jgi:O-antigen ligase/Flp pilus assembly protein TadD